MLDGSIVSRLSSLDGWFILGHDIGLPIIKAILLGIATWLGARFARSSFNYATRRTPADASTRLLVGRIVSLVIVGIGVATILDTLGVPLTSFITVVGVAGLGISLAMQDILKSFVAGTYLLFERPFRIGDEISIKDQRGVVEHVGIRTTMLRTADNVQIIVPNGVMFAELIQNRTNERKPEPVVEDADHEGEVTSAETAQPAGEPISGPVSAESRR